MTGVQPQTTGYAKDRSVRSFDERAASFLHSCEALAGGYPWWIAICCAATLQAGLIITHYAWLDEWQALLIAHQTPSLTSMFAQLHYEGHPQLWYLLLRAVSSAVSPPWVFPATNLMLAATAWWAILARAPFRRFERLLLVLNEVLLLEMFSVSRSLSLGAALLFLALALWRSRLVWIAIALLPLCDFFFGVIACALIVLRIRDREDGSFPSFGMVLFAACAVAAAWGAYPAQHVITDPARGWMAGLFELSRELGTLILPWQTSTYDNPAPFVVGVLLAPFFLYVCASSLRTDRLSRWLLWAFLAILLLFGSSIYPIYFRHTALAALLLIAFVWVRALRNEQPGAVFTAWLCVAALCGLATAVVNVMVPFDTAAKAASIIRQHKLQTKLWFSYPAFRTIALGGESGVSFGNLEQGCAVEFMRWNFQSRIRSREQLYMLLHTAELRYGSFYIVTDVPLPSSVAQPLATVAGGYDGIGYSLWKVGKGPASEGKLPLCVPGLRR